jgi:hypothetical protein
MKPRELRWLVQETYAAHCLLANLGISPDHIYVSTPEVLNAVPRGLYATVTVRDGVRSFTMPLHPMQDEAECDQYLTAFKAFVEAKPRMPNHELDAIVNKSDTYARRLEIVTALVLKGFELPGVPS